MLSVIIFNTLRKNFLLYNNTGKWNDCICLSCSYLFGNHSVDRIIWTYEERDKNLNGNVKLGIFLQRKLRNWMPISWEVTEEEHEEVDIFYRQLRRISLKLLSIYQILAFPIVIITNFTKYPFSEDILLWITSYSCSFLSGSFYFCIASNVVCVRFLNKVILSLMLCLVQIT